MVVSPLLTGGAIDAQVPVSTQGATIIIIIRAHQYQVRSSYTICLNNVLIGFTFAFSILKWNDWKNIDEFIDYTL